MRARRQPPKEGGRVARSELAAHARQRRLGDVLLRAAQSTPSPNDAVAQPRARSPRLLATEAIL